MDIEEKFLMQTPIGVVEISASLQGVQGISFAPDGTEASTIPPALHITKEARDQIKEYFAGRLLTFDLPLHIKGTEFQQVVWEKLQTIPYGRTVMALDLAREIGDARVIRSITPSVSRNPVPLIIPCHRIVGKNGKLTRYRWGNYRKKFLIELEHPFKQGVLF